MAYAYNVDYWDGMSQLNLAPEMLQLRYTNYPKDYFMGMLPSSQYGSVAVMPSLQSNFNSNNLVLSLNPSNVRAVQSGTGSSAAVGVSGSSDASSGTAVIVNSDLSALSIRATLS